MYESEQFYELADRLGLMIWQDLMFACALYPTDDDFVANVRQEVTHQVITDAVFTAALCVVVAVVVVL